MSDDDFTTLRLLRRDKELPPAAVDAALHRARLQFEVAAQATTASTGATPPVPRMRRFRPALLTGAAFVLAGGIVATGIGITHWSSPESAAAATLHEAAAAAIADQAPTGAYTKVVESELSMVYATSDGEHYDEGYLEPTTSTKWVPADVSGTWVRETRSGTPATFYGGAAARKAAADDRATERPGPVWERGAGGDFAVGELGGEQPGVLGVSDIADLPRDPDALVRRIEAASRGAGTTNELHVFDTISGLLRTGLVPADLRAAMYEALATLPDVVVTEKQASLDGRTGTAIGLPHWSKTEQRDVIIDPTDGAYIGERSIQTRRTGSIPAGTVIDAVTVRVTPVEEQPQNAQ
ncbi:CU044_5270 family protein [Curtobacterium flaccumfaciens]|uniref:CU044_5270 family protein n=1 Tax=Curtobacterium flaccumfaciens TaxID=2035 RepID=UPI001601C9DD|nr:CU044_5270 family protein [Curtobacterium flaccumfaciens]MBB1198675.1 hypothetical protein [Curtobacterium flaccumfaciens]